MTNLSELREKAVLPLVWEQPTGPWTFVASPLGLTYRVSESLGGDDATWELRLGNSIVGIYHSEGEAKAAAQADYTQRILTAIDPSLFERIAALEKALEPYAAVADEYNDLEDGDHETWRDVQEPAIREATKLKHFRLARSTLTGEKK